MRSNPIHRRKIGLRLLVWMIVLVAGSMAGAEPEHDLSLELALGQAPQRIYAPLVLRARITNRSDRAVTINSCLGDPSMWRLEVVGPEVRKRQPERGATICSVCQPRTLQPGEVWTDQSIRWSDASRDEPFFPAIGRYHILVRTLVRVRDGRSWPLEGSIDIHVRQPAATDAEMIGCIGSDAELSRLMGAGAGAYCSSRGQPCYERVEMCVKRHPRSVYSPYLAYSLAQLGVNVGNTNRLGQGVPFFETWPDHPLTASMRDLFARFTRPSQP